MPPLFYLQVLFEGGPLHLFEQHSPSLEQLAPSGNSVHVTH